MYLEQKATIVSSDRKYLSFLHIRSSEGVYSFYSGVLYVNRAKYGYYSSIFNGSYCSLCFLITSWVIWAPCNVLEVVLCCNVLISFRTELRTIVRNNHFWYAIPSKNTFCVFGNIAVFSFRRAISISRIVIYYE